ncbi:hypothetical protein [Pseudomonas sp. dw_612]|jgi:hypothetical protein|uniref:hypothetical protein n=1 Tax=Pseudomonas sp. dw_612 TaxID=2720080 RepID=UPI001BD2E9CD|nr:hypothetical protein [Pseudomonas sp. dw_612]
MGYANPNDHRRDKRHKVSLNSTLDKITARAAIRAEKQHGTLLYMLVEWAVENGAIEALAKDRKESSAA